MHNLIAADGALGDKDLEVEAPAVEVRPVVADPEAPVTLPALEDQEGAAATEALPVRNIKQRIREVLEDQITLRVQVDMPAPPPNNPQPLPPAISPQQDKGWDFKWAFGIALSIWLAYQMD